MTTVATAGRPAGRRPAVAVRTFLSRHSSLMPTFAALAIFVVLLVGAQIYFGNFVTPRNMSALLLDNAFLLILAVGMTFVIVTGGIDLSVGSVLALTGILCAKLLADGVSPAASSSRPRSWSARRSALLIGVLVQYFDVQPFIASLAGLFLARGLAFVVSLDSIRVEHSSVLWLQTTRFRFGGGWYITPTGIMALLVVLVGAFVMLYTRFGRTVYAVGGSEQSARLMGLNVARTKVLVYVISGTCGGLAGLVLTAYSGAGYPRNGIGTELDVIAAVVIGGTLLSGRHRLRARIDDRCLRLRHHQDRDLVPRARSSPGPGSSSVCCCCCSSWSSDSSCSARSVEIGSPPIGQNGPVDPRPLPGAHRSDGALRRRRGARRRRLPPLPRRGALADGRERRRQVHADQGDHRGARADRRGPPARRHDACVSRPRTRPSGPG